MVDKDRDALDRASRRLEEAAATFRKAVREIAESGDPLRALVTAMRHNERAERREGGVG